MVSLINTLSTVPLEFGRPRGGVFTLLLHSRRGGLNPAGEDSLAMRFRSHTTRHAAHYNCTYYNRSNNNVNDALRRGNYNNRNKCNNNDNDDDNNIYGRSREETKLDGLNA